MRLALRNFDVGATGLVIHWAWTTWPVSWPKGPATNPLPLQPNLPNNYWTEGAEWILIDLASKGWGNSRQRLVA